MRIMRLILVAALLAFPLATTAKAQVVVGIGVAPVYVPAPVVYGPPVCEWGYYSYYPYACAPYGYYGPEWFYSGVFIGVGPWYGWGGRDHGWRGHDDHYGYGSRGFVAGGRGAIGSGTVRAPAGTSRGFSSGAARGGFAAGGGSAGARGGGFSGGGGHSGGGGGGGRR